MGSIQSMLSKIKASKKEEYMEEKKTKALVIGSGFQWYVQTSKLGCFQIRCEKLAMSRSNLSPS